MKDIGSKQLGNLPTFVTRKVKELSLKESAELSQRAGGETELEDDLKILEVANNSEFQLDDDYSLLDLTSKIWRLQIFCINQQRIGKIYGGNG